MLPVRRFADVMHMTLQIQGDDSHHTTVATRIQPHSHAPRVEVERPATAGLLAYGSNGSPDLPNRWTRSVALWASLAVYSCGGSRGFIRRTQILSAKYRVPFSPARAKARTGTVTRLKANRPAVNGQ
jgi:hypothetical protein